MPTISRNQFCRRAAACVIEIMAWMKKVICNAPGQAHMIKPLNGGRT